MDEARIIGRQAAGQMLIIPDLVLMQEPQHLCSNRAATRIILLKTRAKHFQKKSVICRHFASSSNPQQTISPPSHGGGQGFESPRVHSSSPLRQAHNPVHRQGPEWSPSPYYTNRYTNADLTSLCLIAHARIDAWPKRRIQQP